MSASVNPSTVSSKLKSPDASRSALGRENKMPNISSEVVAGRGKEAVIGIS